ncbi:MAG: Signal transduction histidine kinase [Acidobacteria bacterium]|nr:Signal transduction histidine kinase [Acidobacteriota bacterium]
MPSLRLHTKTTLLASGVTVAIIAALLSLVSIRVAAFVREEQRQLAELQATNFAEHIANSLAGADAEALQRAANLVRGSRPNILTVRVWQRTGGVFSEQIAATGSLPATVIPQDTRAALRSELESRERQATGREANGSLYRVFAPIVIGDRMSGAVEIVERLDDAPAIAVQFERTAFGFALAAVALITISLLLLFRRVVYRPLNAVLGAMQRAEAGDLKARADIRASDELGALAEGFNRMIERINEMTNERDGQAQLLAERISGATSELGARNAELQAANRELWLTTQRLTELERLAAAGQTAAQFAHEVGTPLNLIGGHVQLLEAGADDAAKRQSRLSLIRAQIERISEIVRLMLNRTRPQEVEMEPLNLKGFLRHIFETIAPLLASRGIKLNDEVEVGLPLINASPDRLQQAFINLINNALDAMPDGGELTITARARATAEARAQVVVEVKDTGMGMTDDVRTRIFELMFTTKRRGQGTGLGLVIVQQVMREHKGVIEVASVPGEGTRFRLIFPALDTLRSSNGIKAATASAFEFEAETGAVGERAAAREAKEL